MKDERDWIALQLDESVTHATEVEALHDDAEDTIRYLRSALTSAGNYDEAFAPTPQVHATNYPDDFDELIEMLAGLRHVKFFGDPNVTRSLNDMDSRTNAARKSWKICLVLEDYAKSRADGTAPAGGIHAYLKNPPPGRRSWPTKQHATSESEDVANNLKLRAQRLFEIPRQDEVFMDSHFKVSQEGQISLRLYYRDSAQGDGVIYISYLGPHLDTKHTT